jgi:penicillin amidase
MSETRTGGSAVRGRGGCLGAALAWGVLVVVVLVSTLVAGGTIFIQRTLPTTAGTLTVPGLERTASVIRDRWGVPYITAATTHDVFFAQGYVTAQDRLFQMEFNRRVAGGRLSEIFGAGSNNSLVKTDEFLRTLGLYQAAQAEYQGANADIQAELSAYAEGVNAFIDQHTDTLPLEFTILGFKPQHWSSIDTVAYGRVVALSLDNTWQAKYTRALLLGKVDASAVQALFPPYPQANPTLFTASGQAAPFTASVPSAMVPASTAGRLAPTAAQRTAFSRMTPNLLQATTPLRALLGSTNDALGSNDWVVDGTKTTTGKPLLANDPHLGIREPDIWYQVALRGPGVDVAGFSFPGVPGVIIGHNENIAWGVTNVEADDTDLYLEQLDPTGHPGQYLYQGAWEPLITRQEVITIRGAAPVTITVRSTAEHGPLLDDVVGDLKPLTSATTAIALKWTALQPGYTFVGFFELDRAANWTDFRTAISHISISQNFVYADQTGNIGYQMSGWLPIRSPDNDLLPVSGADGLHEWQGIVPFDQMPSLFDPPTHAIATANNQIVPNDYPLYVTTEWDRGYRARRIVNLLASAPSLSVADYERIQNDVYSVPATQLVPLFVFAGQAAGGDAAAGARMLAGWDDQMTRASGAAALYEVAVGTLARELLEPALGKKLYGIYRDTASVSELDTALIDLLASPRAPFFSSGSVVQTIEARNTVLARALTDAMAQLRATFGADPARWRWGALHKAAFTHPLASVKPLDLIFGIAPVERPGDSTTVNVGGDGDFSADPPDYSQAEIPSMRQIIDLANFDNSLWVIPTGESGQPFSPHYADLLPLWDQGHYQSMAFSGQAIARALQAVLTLKPA